MSSRDAMLRCWIILRALQRAKRSLTGYAAFQLLLHFLCAALFEWVRAAASAQTCDRKQDRHAFHLYIL